MIKIIYISDNIIPSVKFIENLIFDLQKMGIKNIEYDREHNIAVIGNMEIRGICVYESYILHGIRDIKYFIDGIDMKAYENARKERFENLIYHVREVMSHFRENTKKQEIC